MPRRLLACFVACALYGLGQVTAQQPIKARAWHTATDFTQMQTPSWNGALCDPEGLDRLYCDKPIWRELLEQMCRHCSIVSGQCTSDHRLAKLVFEVMHLYTSMLIRHGDKMLTDFGCKHGFLAALLFHAEHVGWEFRPPQAIVEVVRAAAALDYTLGAEDGWRLNDVMDERFKAANIAEMMVSPAALQITDVNGEVVQFEGFLPQVERFPLRVTYRTPAERLEFVNVRRHVTMDQEAALININCPVMSLSPFPMHTQVLRAMHTPDQAEYDQFVANVSGALSAAGVFHVVLHGDSTTSFLGTHFGFLNTSNYLSENFGLDGVAPDTDGTVPDEGHVVRSSIFVPLELREQVMELMWSPGDGPAGLGSHRHPVELGLGHMQVGEPAYGFARGNNYRIFCPFCLWLSVYFYVTEVRSSVPNTGSVLPLAFWLPCRLASASLFPVRWVPMGSTPETLVPRPRDLKDPPKAAGMMKSEQERRLSEGVYHGSCRESVQRILQRLGPQATAPAARQSPGSLPQPALPPVLPELLPMHDMSSRLNDGTNLDMLMALKQIHAGPGLEMYQDKIALSLDFQARGLRVPKLYYHSYDLAFDVRPTLRDLEAKGVPYVAKASHMCCSQAVFVMDGSGFDRVSGERVTLDHIQAFLQQSYIKPFNQVTPKCGDWGTVKAGEKPGVLVEEMMTPSVPLGQLREQLGGGDWQSPDIVACHLSWSTLLHCVWELKMRGPDGKVHTEDLGMIFRDGSCLSCRHPMPFRDDWPGTVALLEGLLPHADYLRITLFVKDGRPVINEVEYTSGGLEIVPVRIAREWTLRWLEGYHRYHS